MHFSRVVALVSAIALQLVAPSAVYAEAMETKAYGEVEADKALLYAIRPKGARGGNSVALELFSSTTFLLRLRGNSYGFVHLDPGRHKIWGIGGLDEIEFVPGETFYLMTGDSGTALLTEDEGKALIEAVRYYMPPEPEVEAEWEVKEEKAQKRLRFFEKTLTKRQQRMPIPSPPPPKRPDNTNGLLHVPPYSPIKLELMETVSSYRSLLGEEIWLRVREDARVDGEIWLPAGTPVKGRIAEIHQAGGGGGSGGLEIVIPSVELGNGEQIPLIGQMIDTGRDRAGAAYTAAAALGLLGGALVKGREAFELNGEQWRVWTRVDVWTRVHEQNTPPTVAAEAGPPLTVQARLSENPHVDLEKHKEIGEISVFLETEKAVASLALEAVGDWDIPKPPAASRVERRGSMAVAAFDGWSLFRHLRQGNESIPVRFVGKTEDGERLVAVGTATWKEGSAKKE